MIREGLSEDDEDEEADAAPQKQSVVMLALTAVATSIDAMAVGVGLAFIDVNILEAALLIGLATTTMVTIGVMVGRVLGHLIGKRAEIIGGVVLIGVGAAILYEHLSRAGADSVRRDLHRVASRPGRTVVGGHQAEGGDRRIVLVRAPGHAHFRSRHLAWPVGGIPPGRNGSAGPRPAGCHAQAGAHQREDGVALVDVLGEVGFDVGRAQHGHDAFVEILAMRGRMHDEGLAIELRRGHLAWRASAWPLGMASTSGSSSTASSSGWRDDGAAENRCRWYWR
jgi:hypothetical protein